MTFTEEINTGSGLKLFVEKRIVDGQIEISLRVQGRRNCLLHWGLSRCVHAPWRIPPQSLWPQGSRTSGQTALQTPFLGNNGEDRILIRLNQDLDFSVMDFVLFFPEEDRWDNNFGKNYTIKLSKLKHSAPTPAQFIYDRTKQEYILFHHLYHLDEDGQLAVCVVKDNDLYSIFWVTDIPGPLILHWGVARQTRDEWFLPSTFIRPAGTRVIEKKAVQTPFIFSEGLNQLKIEIQGEKAPFGIPFLLKEADTGWWFKNRGGNFFIPIRALQHKQIYAVSPKYSGVTEEIIHAEMGSDSWTLMHRFNLCHDVLDVLGHDEEGLVYIFVWLRFSAIRQLTWQRYFNTQPRALSHALDRLTLKLSHIYVISDPKCRELIRLILTTLGRGGEGQRIRDEFLNIMHRHKIKEVSGHFLEEWHQKIHNNTTPDDIVICQAYLAFLRHNGNLDLFFKVLGDGGVSKERLEGFERPIVSEPEFYSEIKDKLIQDFEQYLKILKSVHSGTDLETAVESTRHLVDKKTNLLLNFISEHRDDPKAAIVDLIEKIAEVRTLLKNLACHHWDDEKIRDLLLLDLALEESMRILVEQHIHHLTDEDQLVDLIASVLDNVHLNYDDDEISACYRHWVRLKEMPRLGRNWSLHAKAVVDRLGRAIGDYIDRYYRLIQPKAEFFGKAFHADSWTITLFSEEVVRGRPIFILSMLLRHLDPILRQKANLSNWQVICPGQATGRVKVVDTLHSIQGKTFSMPAIIIADKIGGEEEIPGGVTAIITPDLVDIVSHIAIRARNKRLLFATCYDLEMIDTLKSLNGRSIHLAVDSKGEVETKKRRANRKKTKKIGFQTQNVPEIHPDMTLKAISSTDFNEETVGRKSLNLILLKSKLPDWIHLPASIALPFGVFEKVLSEGLNKNIARQHKRLIQRIEENPPEILAEIRKTLMDLEPPDGLQPSLESALVKAEMPYPEKWDRIWTCIKQVWSSKWNERAYLSRQTRGIPHDNLFIAVLIQQVVEAEYAFVIHTVNPFTGNQNELYAEIVSGLGETLVGNYPGRALSFISNKDRYEPSLISYPSKSFGLYGHQGLIFRSDSNGEDLSDYAGAGLYDSVMLEPPREILLDYTKEPLLWDEDFRSDLLLHIIQIGLLVEEAFGSHPQDIEGAYSKGNFYVLQSRSQVGL